jgi:hypothetical protein
LGANHVVKNWPFQLACKKVPVKTSDLSATFCSVCESSLDVSIALIELKTSNRLACSILTHLKNVNDKENKKSPGAVF